MAFYRPPNSTNSYLFLYGGYDDKLKQPANPSQLLVVDLNRRSWYYSPFLPDGSNFEPEHRIGAAIAQSSSTFYLFGGCNVHNVHDNSSLLSTYSAFEVIFDTNGEPEFIWTVKDTCLPPHVPNGGRIGRAPVVTHCDKGENVLIIVPGWIGWTRDSKASELQAYILIASIILID
jgi:hypothetical protein